MRYLKLNLENILKKACSSKNRRVRLCTSSEDHNIQKKHDQQSVLILSLKKQFPCINTVF